MIKKPKDILEQWMKAVNEGDVKTLLNLYDNNAVLIPTFSNRLLNTPEKLKDYFEKLGSREDLSIALHEKTLIIQELENQIFSSSFITNS